MINVKKNVKSTHIKNQGSCCSTPTNDNKQLPVAIIGGGPVGLAAAAHLISRGESFVLFDAGEDVGANIMKWAHVRLFSPWEFNINKAAKQLLLSNGWVAPDHVAIPTGKELIEMYLKPLSELPEMKPYIHLNAKVTAVSRKGLSKVKTQGREQLSFMIYVDKNEEQIAFEAKAVIDASGTWTNPNPVHAEGVFTTAEQSLHNQIYYGIPDILGDQQERYSGKKVLVVGSGHSAIHTLLDLGSLKEQVKETEIVWVLRKSNLEDVYGGRDLDSLPARGELGIRIQKLVDTGIIRVMTSFHIEELKKKGETVQVAGSIGRERISIEGIDEIISNTGSRPDLSFIREVRVTTDPSLESVSELAPLIDPNVHSCGTVRPHGEKELRQPEKDFYIVGSKSYGRAPTFLMATGYEQVRSVVAALVGDMESAERVELELPETGVCSIGTQSSNDLEDESVSNSGCCSTQASKSEPCCG